MKYVTALISLPIYMLLKGMLVKLFLHTAPYCLMTEQQNTFFNYMHIFALGCLLNCAPEKSRRFLNM